jgi:putative ATPase
VGRLNISVTAEAMELWAVKCDGDVRKALTALEVAVLSSNATARSNPDSTVVVIDRAVAEESIQQKAVVYDWRGDQHYDAASALIKSVRGSDPDAALYWLAVMLEAGEDVRFIARRLAILASEDVGNADPRGIMVAAAAWELVERIGMPEARITLAQCVTYLACTPKSNASYLAIDAAMADVREGRTLAVPMHIKDGNVRKASDLSSGGARGDSYQYAHDSPDAIGLQSYLGVEKIYYNPTGRGSEKVLADYLERARSLRAAASQGNLPDPRGGA